ncbi:MAG: hypothetical protein ACOCUI_04065 [bacterium]
MELCVDRFFRIKNELWIGYKCVFCMLGRLNIHYKFLGWRIKDWRKDLQGNRVWRYWYNNPIFGIKKWNDGRFAFCILYNDFTFQIIKQKSLDVYYGKYDGKYNIMKVR